jgi:hypothetical protein
LKRSLILWVVAVVVTLASAVWQRVTGPTYPMAVEGRVGGHAVEGEFIRSQTIDTAVPVEVTVAEPVTGEIRWRRWPSDDPWRTEPLVREGDALVGTLPGQPFKAAKIEYGVVLRDAGGSEATFGTRLRFKGAVPTPILVVHVFAMFFGMLFSFRAGLEALVKGPALRRQTVVTLLCLGVGGLLLGPIVQRHAFDAYWTGWPVGEDLTDNKLAVAVAFWAVALWQQRRGRYAWSVVAAVVTFVIFVIPHSLHGSTHDYETGQHIQAALRRGWPLA